MYWFLSYITWSDVKDIFTKSESQFSSITPLPDKLLDVLLLHTQYLNYCNLELLSAIELQRPNAVLTYVAMRLPMADSNLSMNNKM